MCWHCSFPPSLLSFLPPSLISFLLFFSSLPFPSLLSLSPSLSFFWRLNPEAFYPWTTFLPLIIFPLFWVSCLIAEASNFVILLSWPPEFLGFQSWATCPTISFRLLYFTTGEYLEYREPALFILVFPVLTREISNQCQLNEWILGLYKRKGKGS